MQLNIISPELNNIGIGTRMKSRTLFKIFLANWQLLRILLMSACDLTSGKEGGSEGTLDWWYIGLTM
jgi:hypothetical protein